MANDKSFYNLKSIFYQPKTDFSSTCKDTTLLIILFVKEKTKEKFREFQSKSLILECELKFATFEGNKALKVLLTAFNKQGCDFIHNQDCNCIACNHIKNKYSYISDTIGYFGETDPPIR